MTMFIANFVDTGLLTRITQGDVLALKQSVEAFEVEVSAVQSQQPTVPEPKAAVQPAKDE